MEERIFKGIWIPKEIWLTEELSLQEKVVLVEIDSLDDEEKGCYASNKYFADFFKLSSSRVSQIISKLKEKGYLDISFHYKGDEITERVIKINRPPFPKVFRKLNTYLENDKEGIKKTKEGYLENCEKNNKINKFIKPTLEEVKAYCLERNNKVDAEYFINYYETNGWVQGKNKPIKDWKACVRTWEKNSKDTNTSEEEYGKGIVML